MLDRVSSEPSNSLKTDASQYVKGRLDHVIFIKICCSGFQCNKLKQKAFSKIKKDCNDVNSNDTTFASEKPCIVQ